MKKVIIDYAALNAALQRQSSILRDAADEVMIPQIEEEKQNLIQDIYDHEVSQELDRGSNSELYSLIGFEEGRDPVGELVDVIQDSVVVPVTAERLKAQGKSVDLVYSVTIPTTQDLEREDSLDVDWSNGRLGNWVLAIERGIPGFTRFLQANQRRMGRSGGGIQLKTELRTNDYEPRSYFSDFMGKFSQRLLKLSGGFTFTKGGRKYGVRNKKGQFST